MDKNDSGEPDKKGYRGQDKEWEDTPEPKWPAGAFPALGGIYDNDRDWSEKERAEQESAHGGEEVIDALLSKYFPDNDKAKPLHHEKGMPEQPSLVQESSEKERDEYRARHWNRTILGTERVKSKGVPKGEKFYDNDGNLIGITKPLGKNRIFEFNGKNFYRTSSGGLRDIIGRDTPIGGGVYIGGSEREVIIADFDYILEGFYTSIKHDPRSIYEAVRHAIKHDEAGTEEIMADHRIRQGTSEPEIYLSEFMKKGSWVCRHAALAAALLIERAIKDGEVKGSVSIDRGGFYGDSIHAWCRYTDERGNVYIIDPVITFDDEEEPGVYSMLEFTAPAYERPSDRDYLRRKVSEGGSCDAGETGNWMPAAARRLDTA